MIYTGNNMVDLKSLIEFQIGKIGEFLTCADISLNGYNVNLSGAGCEYDIILDICFKPIRIQVKTTRGRRIVPQRESDIPMFMFHINRNGSKGRKRYEEHSIDMFALVELETRSISYLPFSDINRTMFFRIPSLRGNYRDEVLINARKHACELKLTGLTLQQISERLDISFSTVCKYVYTKREEIEYSKYFDEYTLSNCLSRII